MDDYQHGIGGGATARRRYTVSLRRIARGAVESEVRVLARDVEDARARGVARAVHRRGWPRLDGGTGLYAVLVSRRSSGAISGADVIGVYRIVVTEGW